MKWLLASGVPEDKIYAETDVGQALESALKDCREDDLFLVWSQDVFGDQTQKALARIQAKGAEAVFAADVV